MENKSKYDTPKDVDLTPLKQAEIIFAYDFGDNIELITFAPCWHSNTARANRHGICQ